MKKIPVWPTLATIGNLLCGFSAVAAIGAAMASATGTPNFLWPAWLIMIAMVFDALDGRLARLTRTATEFGAELDSLADVVSFGLAPAMLIHGFVRYNLPNYSDKFAWTAGALFLLCAALRLARFNVETTTDDDSHRSFKGLPSPGAAGLLATAVIFLYEIAPELPKGHVTDISIGLLPILEIVAAVLMVTRIRYPHIVSQLDLGDRPFSFLVLIIFVGMFVMLAPQIGLFLLFTVYAASGPVGLTIDQLLERFAASDSEDSLF